MKFFVTGGAGFIGSNLVDKLLRDGHQVIAYDNLSTGQIRFLNEALDNEEFKFIEGDLLDKEKLNESILGSEIVIHFAANADIKDGLSHPYKDLEQNTIATFNLLEAMRENNITKIGFSSTGSVYGECKVIPTPENAPFPIQTSLYASSKLACEALIQSYCEGFGFQSWIFRFVSILGERYSHGHVYDFYKQLINNPNELKVLGNGKQEKSYLYIKDCIDGVLHAIENADNKINIFNLGTNETCILTESISEIVKELELDPKLNFTGGNRGWVGDNPLILLDASKIEELGWAPKVSIKDGIIKTVKYLQKNSWLIGERS